MLFHQKCRILSSAMWVICVLTLVAVAREKLSIEQVINPAYPFELVAARKADRLAWISYERGMRNVYTAAAPDFKPVRLTSFTEDDGNDLTSLGISDDGSMLVFVRGHGPNREGWIANPASNPDGIERAIWAIRASGSKPWRLAEGGNPRLSPDGKWVAFARDGKIFGVRTEQGKTAPAGEKGAEPLFKTFGNNSGPVWSPDATRLAFVSGRDGHSFIGVFDLRTRRITYLEPGVDNDRGPAWSPDGKQVAFLRRPGTPFAVQLQSRAAAAAGTAVPGGQPPIPRPGAPGTDQGPREGVAQGQRMDGMNRAALPGGHTLAMWVVDAETGKGKEFWRNDPVDADFAQISSIEWAGSRVVFEVERNNWQHRYSLPVDGSAAEALNLTPGEGFAEQVGLSPDGKDLYYASNVGDIDRRHIWRTPVGGGQPVNLTPDHEIATHPVALSSGRWFAALVAGAREPQAVGLFPSQGGRPKVIFPDLSRFPRDLHVIPENVVLAAEDGLKFHNQLFLPQDVRPGERRPAMIFVHGGPARQMLLGYHYRHFYHMAYGINQYLASQGYVVLSVNFRTGIGYGRDFRRAPNSGARGNAEYQDVVAAGKYLQERPDVDPKRIGIWGLSYGGLLTAQALARNSDMFAAGVDIAGVHLWGNSVDPESVSYKSSPIAAIDRWRSPVLLIHGDDDRNVAFSQTTGLVQLLRAHGVYHELIVYPDDVHVFLLHHRWLKAFHAMDDFFRRFLK